MDGGLVWTAALFALGVALVVKGGGWFLEGAVWLAEATGLPRFVIGATVVSLATTLPELTVSATGVLKGQVDLAVGNAVGSVAANLGLILGLSALYVPGGADRRQFAGKAGLMLLALALLQTLCRGGEVTAIGGAILLAVFSAYVWLSLRDARDGREAQRQPITRRQLSEKGLRFLLGLGAIIGGSQLLVDHGGDLALALGVPAGVIGVTLVAVGTTLPELVTTVTAIRRREGAMSVGNIIGANVIDLTLILPVCALLSGGRLTVSRQTAVLDLPVCLLLGAAAMAPPLMKGRFARWQGAALLGLYGAYLLLVTLAE